MGATSVTGVSGRGMAYGTKGPSNKRNLYSPLVNPHVVAAGTAVVASTTAVVTFPKALAESEASYAVLITGEATTVGAAYVVKHDTAGKFDYFTINTAGAGDVMWVVVKTGLGLDITA